MCQKDDSLTITIVPVLVENPECLNLKTLYCSRAGSAALRAIQLDSDSLQSNRLLIGSKVWRPTALEI